MTSPPVAARATWLAGGLALVAWFAFLVWANVVTALWADDYCRIGPPDTAAAAILAVTTAWHDYFFWGGRVVVTAITWFVLSTGRAHTLLWFDVLNAMVFLALVVIAVRLASLAAGRRATGPWGTAAEILLAALMLWWLPRAVGEAALWKTGAIGYLWAVASEGFVVLAAIRARSGKVWLAPLAFVAAMSLEPLSVLVSLVLWVLAATRRRHGRPAPLAAAVAHALGTLTMLAAPGNAVRAAALPPSSLADRLDGVFGHVGSLVDPVWIPAVAVVALPWALWSWHRPAAAPPPAPLLATPRLAYLGGAALLFPAAAATYEALLLGVPRGALSARVSFPASVLLACYLLAVFMRRPDSARSDRVLAGLLLTLLVAHVAIVAPDLRALAGIAAGRDADPRLASGPASDVIVPAELWHGRRLVARKHVFFVGLTPDPSYFANVCFAATRAVRSVRAE